MKILFIAPSLLGDGILSTGVLHFLLQQNPHADVTIVCGAASESLFQAIPQVSRVIVLKRLKHNKHWLKFLKECFWQNWDIVVDLRHAFVSHFLFARKRYSLKRRDDVHRVVQNAICLKIGTTPSPHIWVTAEARKKAAELMPSGAPVLAIGPAANWIGKIWPTDNFIELIKKLTDKGGVFAGARVAVLAAANEKDMVMPVLESIPAERRIDLVGKGTPLDMAACLERCACYIGNDSGLMHLAAALGMPTLGLFGQSRIDHFRPWGQYADFVQTDLSYDELTAQRHKAEESGKLTKTLMTSLPVDKVERAVHKLMDKAKADVHFRSPLCA